MSSVQYSEDETQLAASIISEDQNPAVFIVNPADGNILQSAQLN